MQRGQGVCQQRAAIQCPGLREVSQFIAVNLAQVKYVMSESVPQIPGCEVQYVRGHLAYIKT